MHFLKLIRILVVRNIREEKFFTLLSILGIALGIGLFIGVKVAADRAAATFASDIQGINPAANFEVHDVFSVDFDETIYESVRDIEGRSFPVIKTFAYVPDHQEIIQIRGIDTLRTPRLLELSRSLDIDFEYFVKQLDGILITRKFADQYSLRKGDTIRAAVYNSSYILHVAGILDNTLMRSTQVIMDIGNFQEYFKKFGYLSQIDLVTDHNTMLRIQKVIPQNLSVEQKAAIFRNQQALVSSFRYNLQFVSFIAILAGFFLLYNTVFISVVKRRAEIGILRGLGTDRKTIVLLFGFQGIFLGTVGSLLGILFGQLAAYFSVIAVEKTISTMYMTISITDYLLNAQDILTALFTGVTVSFLASAIPSFEASKIRPYETSREGSFERRYGRFHIHIALFGSFAVLVGILMSYFEYSHTPFAFPFLSYISMLCIIAGFTFMAPFILSCLLRLLKFPADKILKSIGKIALGDLRGNIFRFSVALMTVAMSSALIVALLILIFSFKNSLRGWIEKNITADIYIKPASCLSNYCFYPLSDEIIFFLQGLPEVKGIDRFRALHIELFGKKVIAGFGDTSIKRLYAEKRYSDQAYDAILEEMAGEKPVLGISEYIHIKYGIQTGETLELPTPKGPKSFTVTDIFTSYSTTAGFLYIDRKWLREFWGLNDATQISIYVKDGVRIDPLIGLLKRSLLPGYSLEIMNNQELREKINNIFNKTFAITYAIECISILVSLIGVINTLLALVLEKKREISIVRYLGGTFRQIRRTLVLSAAVVGLSGIALGVSMGMLMSFIFIYTVNKVSFGWSIALQIPFGFLLLVMFLLFLTILFAGYLPSGAVRKIDPKNFISYE